MKKIAIIAAEKQELAGLAEFLQDCKTVPGGAGCTFLMGNCNDLEVAAMQCGIGKVNAAIGTQVLVDTFHPDCLINVGVAGALGEGIKVFDVVISEKCVQHDMNVAGLGYAPGIIPDQEVSYFQADEKLVKLAQEAAQKENLNFHTGLIASGDVFVSTKEERERIYTTFGALCTEMEGASVAHTAYRNQTPYVVIRSMSDSADGQADVSYTEFSAQASQHALAILKNMLSQL